MRKRYGGSYAMRDKKFVAVAIFSLTLILLLSVFLMKTDDVYSGDEVLTHSLANSYYNAWMMSDSRVGGYLKSNILDESFVQTIKNAGNTVLDIVKNRRNAAYFKSERPMETGWYPQAEMKDWFYVYDTGEAFKYSSVYFNAMTDDGNPFLYNAMVHTVSSIALNQENLKWYIFSINAIFYIATFILLFKTAKRIGLSDNVSLATCVLWAGSVNCFMVVTNLRSYTVATFFVLILYYFHCQLYEAINSQEEEKFKKVLFKIVPVFVAGYLIHYSIAIFFVALMINTMVIMFFARNQLKKKWVIRYLLSNGIAVGIALLCDPMSVFGLLYSFVTDRGGEIGKTSLIQEIANEVSSVLEGQFGNIIFFILYIAIIGVVVSIHYRKKAKIQFSKSSKQLFGAVAIYIVVAIAAMGRYLTIIFPLFTLVLVVLIKDLLKEIPINGNRHWQRIAILLCIGAFLTTNTSITYRKKQMENEMLMGREGVHAEYSEENVVYVRLHARSFENMQMISNYQNALIITMPDGNYYDYGEDDRIKNQEEIVVHFADGVTKEQKNEITDWMKNEEGFSENIQLCSEGENEIYLFTR